MAAINLAHKTSTISADGESGRHRESHIIPCAKTIDRSRLFDYISDGTSLSIQKGETIDSVISTERTEVCVKSPGQR